MSSLRSLLLIIVLPPILLGLSDPTVALAEDRASNTVMIEFPIGDIEIRHLESSRGMILEVMSRPICIEARRLYFGDGKHAVKYEGSQFGMKTPGGLVKVGAIQLKNGETIKTTAATLEEWGSKAGEVYILVPNLQFESE